MKISRFPQGTRVRIRKGSFPLDPALVGRTGMVLDHDRANPHKVNVQLDHEEPVRTFMDFELEREADGGQDPAP
jgi:hypothetical protein